jgi:hypothetical protein
MRKGEFLDKFLTKIYLSLCYSPLNKHICIQTTKYAEKSLLDAKNPKSVVEESRAAAVECPEDIQLVVNRS